jgi:hypothetical protein
MQYKHGQGISNAVALILLQHRVFLSFSSKTNRYNIEGKNPLKIMSCKAYLSTNTYSSHLKRSWKQQQTLEKCTHPSMTGSIQKPLNASNSKYCQIVLHHLKKKTFY